MVKVVKSINSSDLKTILHSKRANIYYLEHCRVLVNGGRVEYVTEQGKESCYWNIPIANTTTILLGTGTSVTQAAMKELARAGVLVGFCGGGGTPLFSVNEMDIEVAWFSPQSEYRSTEYLQLWVKFWFQDDRRLEAAKYLQQSRLQKIKKEWIESDYLKRNDFAVPSQLKADLEESQVRVKTAKNVDDLLLEEARLTKKLFHFASEAVKYGEFTRSKKGSGIDLANRFLDHGNYLAYGLGATATWVLGLPHGLSVLHGKTRRGGLVFDAADLVKDAVILPQAFISAVKGDEEREFRRKCIERLVQTEALDFMIDQFKDIAGKIGGNS